MKKYTWRKLNKVAKRLNNNEIAILPTSGVYGIFAKVNSANHKTINSIKKSAPDKPLSVMFSNIDHVFQSMIIPASQESLIRENLPGLTTFILKPKPQWIAENGFEFLGETVAVRVPTDFNLMSLLGQTGPMFTTSANITDYETITTLEEAESVFSNQVVISEDEFEMYEDKDAKISFMLDDGKLGTRPSTIIDATTDKMKIIRAHEVGIGTKDVKTAKSIKKESQLKEEVKASKKAKTKVELKPTTKKTNDKKTKEVAKNEKK